MKFSPSLLEDIKSRISLLDEVRRRVPGLKKKGKGYWACCPFHQEKSPSFQVLEQDGFYHCFGCGAHGDVFKFIQETQGGTFLEVVQQLAQQAGVRLPKLDYNPETEARRQDGFACLARAQAFYRQGARQVAQYLTKRGITHATADEFGIGYAPNSWDETRTALLSEGFAPEVLRETGLAIQHDTKKTDYDRFRDRLMIPIHDLQGRVVAFGGRILGAGEPKYLNSPETPFFHKGNLLYNLNRARAQVQPSASGQHLIIVEGYFDAIALWQAGVKTAVAPMGTAITPEQIQTAWRYDPTPFVCLDGDTAGQNAAARLAERILPVLKPSVSLRFIYLPQGEDPDSFIRTQGLSAWQALLAQPTRLEDVLWATLTAGLDTTHGLDRAAAEAKIQHICQSVADETVQKHLRADWKNRLWQTRQHPAQPGPTKPEQFGYNSSQNLAQPGSHNAKWVPRLATNLMAQEVLACLAQYPALLADYIEDLAECQFDSPQDQTLQRHLLDFFATGGLAGSTPDAYVNNPRLREYVAGLVRRYNIPNTSANAPESVQQRLQTLRAQWQQTHSQPGTPAGVGGRTSATPEEQWQHLQEQVRHGARKRII